MSSSNVIGMGTDIIEIGRIKEAVAKYGERFIKRIFCEEEEMYCKQFADPFPRYAGRFAAKEATIKALGFIWDSPVPWHHIKILREPTGKPTVFFHEALAAKLPECEMIVSISHCKEYAMATALLLSKQ